MTDDKSTQIDAEPTKSFFVDMLTRDIPLEQAILDLVDNCVDGAKSMGEDGAMPFANRSIKLEFGTNSFRILDNCGGFSREAAREYAFRFGRPANAQRASHSIGQFGVGMKRALFKFGRHFVVRSATIEDTWSVEVNVPKWEGEPGWHFPWTEFKGNEFIGPANPGTEIIVTELRSEVSRRFGTKNFETEVINLIQSKHRQFIANGISVSVNGTHLAATDLKFLTRDGLNPGTEIMTFADEGVAAITVKIVVAVGPSAPRQAGWYVVCNGRVILEADRSTTTGWGVVEESQSKLVIPNYHNQFSRFRGIVFFDSNDSARVPWNTTKTDVDKDNPVWQTVFQKMIEMMRPVISFLNDLDNDIDDHPQNESPLLQFVHKSNLVAPETLTISRAFNAPSREAVKKGPKTTKIQYSRLADDVDFMKDALGVSSAVAVGEKTFDLMMQRQRGE